MAGDQQCTLQYGVRERQQIACPGNGCRRQTNKRGKIHHGINFPMNTLHAPDPVPGHRYRRQITNRYDFEPVCTGRRKAQLPDVEDKPPPCPGLAFRFPGRSIARTLLFRRLAHPPEMIGCLVVFGCNNDRDGRSARVLL